MELLKKWKDKVVNFADVEIKLIKLNLIQRASAVVSYLIFTIIVIFLLLCVFLFLGFGLAEWFTVLLNSRIAGFFTTIAAYVIIIAIVFMMRKVITGLFTGTFIKILTENDKEDAVDKDDH